MSKLTDLAAKISSSSPAIKAFAQEAAAEVDALTARVAKLEVVCVPIPPPPPPPPAGVEGRVNFCVYAETPFDPYTTNPAWRPFIQQHWQRGIVWDPPVGWWWNGWPYRDSIVASYTEQDPAGTNPYIAKAANGNKLKVNFANDQWLADFSRADYRQSVLTWAKAQTDGGKHAGIYLDDVNLSVSTKDSVTGATGVLPAGWTALDWENNLCAYLEFLKANLPGVEITHNAVWYDSPNHDGNDPYVRRRLAACTNVLVERWVSDTGLTLGTGQWSYERLFQYVDACHAAGAGVVYLDYGTTKQAALFAQGCALLVSNGHDYIFSNWANKPDNWDPMWDANYEAALGGRAQLSANVWQRRFTKATVTVDLAAKTAVIA